MELKIKNIGKIRDSSIEFNGLTVIAGINSTGKSTISKTLYCIFNSLSNFDSNNISEIKKAIRNQIYSLFDLFREKLDITDYVERIFHLRKDGIDNDRVLKIIDNAINYIKSNGVVSIPDEEFAIQKLNVQNTILNILKTKDSVYRLNRCEREFQNEFGKQINSLFNNEEGEVVLNLKKRDYVFKFVNDKLVDLSQDINILYDILYYDDPNLISDLPFIWRMNRTRNSKIAHFLSNNDYNTVDEVILNQRLSCIDHLIKIIDVGALKRNNGIGYTILDSKYRKPLNISNLSMGSKALLVLIQIFHSSFMKDNNILILDEPEIHLHPEWQIILAEMIVLIQREFSLTCLINTHSPYFVNAIETYSNKYKTNNNCKYYFAENDDENRFARFSDCTQNTDIIYKSLSEPFDRLLETRGDL